MKKTEEELNRLIEAREEVLKKIDELINLIIE